MKRSSQRLRSKGVASSSSSKAKRELIDVLPGSSEEEAGTQSSGGGEEPEIRSPKGEGKVEEAGSKEKVEETGEEKKVEETGDDSEEEVADEAEFGFAEDGEGLEGLFIHVEEEKMTDKSWALNKWTTTVEDKHIEAIRVKYSVPATVTMRAAQPGEIPGKPQKGEVAFCRSFFLAGVRLPLHPLFCQFLIFCGAAPLQINPNVWKAMLSCVILWRKHLNRDISLTELVACFSLKGVAGNKGVYYANSWNKILTNPVDAKVWKNNWFFVGGDWEGSSADPAFSPQVHTTFHTVPPWKNPFKRLPKDAQKRFKKIRELTDAERSPKSLITEENLTKYELAKGK